MKVPESPATDLPSAISRRRYTDRPGTPDRPFADMTDAAKTQLQQTLLAAAVGDEQAWRTIVDLYAARVFALLRAQWPDDELAEEITQSTFCTVASKLADYTELGRFEAWLFRIAMNRLRDEMRRRKRQAINVESDALATLPGSGMERDQPDRPDEEQIVALRRAMAKLSESDRHIIHLRHHGGLSFRQIADVLGEPLGTVLARQHRALQKLADLMEPSPAAPSEPKEQSDRKRPQ